MVFLSRSTNGFIHPDTIAQRAKISVADDLVVEVGPGKAKNATNELFFYFYFLTHPYWPPMIVT